MKQYEKPKFVKTKGLGFVLWAIRVGKAICRQCSGCHGCR